MVLSMTNIVLILTNPYKPWTLYALLKKLGVFIEVIVSVPIAMETIMCFYNCTVQYI